MSILHKARDYQREAHDSIIRELESLISTLVVMPTGTGKTVLFALFIHTVVSKTQKRVLVIAHREELIWQARNKIEAITGLECSIEMGDLSSSPSLFGRTPVVVSTIQTQNSAMGDRKRMSRFNPKDFCVVVIDEAHHATAASYQNLINYYKTQNPEIKILGVTATPDRSDEEALGQVFDSVAFNYEILDAISDGWLVPIEQQFVGVSGLDFSAVRSTAGDLNGADLAYVMELESNMQGVAGATLEIVGDKPSILFAASVKQAETVSNILNRHRQGMSAWVCGETNKDIRRQINSEFESGKVQVLCNCGVYTEGYDNPLIQSVIMARPTKSRALYAQIAGRGTRPLPGLVDGLEDPKARCEAIRSSAKPSCLIVDFVGNSGRHKLMTTADILGGNVSDEVINKAVIRAKSSKKAVNMKELIEEEVEALRKKLEEARLAEEARKAKVVAKVSYQSRSVNPFDLLDISPHKERGWDQGRVLTEKQRALLIKNGIKPEEVGYTKGKQILDAMFKRMDKHLATLPQLRVLARYGYTNHQMTFDEARKTLDALAKNGWKR